MGIPRSGSSRWGGGGFAPRGKALPRQRPSSRAPPSYAVHSLLLTVQALRSLDEAADWVDGEVFPVPVARGFQEAVAHGPVEALILVCGVDLIHVGAQWDLLRGRQGREVPAASGRIPAARPSRSSHSFSSRSRMSLPLSASLGKGSSLGWTLLESEHLLEHPLTPPLAKATAHWWFSLGSTVLQLSQGDHHSRGYPHPSHPTAC